MYAVRIDAAGLAARSPRAELARRARRRCSGSPARSPSPSITSSGCSRSPAAAGDGRPSACRGRTRFGRGTTIGCGRSAAAARRSREAAKADGNSFAFSLSIPGEVELGAAAAGGRRPERLPGTGAAEPSVLAKWAARGAEVGVAARALALPLAVRSRRPGDRFRPLGAPGDRKLQDFLVDRKVPREERDSLPARGRRPATESCGSWGSRWRRTFASRTPHKA